MKDLLDVNEVRSELWKVVHGDSQCSGAGLECGYCNLLDGVVDVVYRVVGQAVLRIGVADVNLDRRR